MKYLKIKKNTDFQRLFKRGKRVFSPYMTLLYLSSDKLRFGVAVSKKHGKAVVRNRIKRLVRAVFYKNCGNLQKPYSVIILPKVNEKGEYTYALFEKGLQSCIKKVNEA